MGCLLERSLPHLIPGAWKSTLHRAPSSGGVGRAFIQGGNLAERRGSEARKERSAWDARPLLIFVAKCFADGDIIWWKLLFLLHVLALQSRVNIIFLKPLPVLVNYVMVYNFNR